MDRARLTIMDCGGEARMQLGLRRRTVSTLSALLQINKDAACTFVQTFTVSRL